MVIRDTNGPWHHRVLVEVVEAKAAPVTILRSHVVGKSGCGWSPLTRRSTGDDLQDSNYTTGQLRTPLTLR